MASVLRHYPAFRRLLVGQLISSCGDWFNYVAIITMIGDVEGRGVMAIAWLTVLKQLPMFLVAAPAGVLADKFDRRTILLVCDLLRAALILLTIPAAAYHPWAVLILVGLSSAVAGFFDPARIACVPQLVGGVAQLREAHTWASYVWPFSMFVGSALGGLTTEFLGAQTSLVLDAVSFLISAGFIFTLPALPARAPETSEEVVNFRSFLKTHLFSFERKIAVTQKGIFGIAGAVYLIQSLLGIGLDFGKTGAAGLSATLIARALGALSGALVIKRFFSKKSELNVITAGYMFSGLAYAAVGFDQSPVIFLGSIFFAHFGSLMVWVYSTIWIQRIFYLDERGRAASLDVGLNMLTTSVSAVVIGTLITSSVLSARAAAFYCGSFWIGVAAVLWLVGRRFAQDELSHAK